MSKARKKNLKVDTSNDQSHNNRGEESCATEHR